MKILQANNYAQQ